MNSDIKIRLKSRKYCPFYRECAHGQNVQKCGLSYDDDIKQAAIDHDVTIELYEQKPMCCFKEVQK